ncbi:MAG: DUF2550 domain-containing protein [Cellulomonas sp.]
MTGAHTALALGALVLLVFCALALGTSRVRTLSRRVGSFECAFSRATDPDAPWIAGIGQYGAESLYWWRWWSLAPRPTRSWLRARTLVIEHHGVADARGYEGQIVVRCRTDDDAFDLLMSAEAYAGLASWLEAAPPAASRVI